MFNREKKSWVALVTAVAFIWVFQVSAPSRDHVKRADSPVNTDEAKAAAAKDSMGAVEKITATPEKMKKKHFPWLMVTVGAVVVSAAVYYFLVYQKKEFKLSVTQGQGVTGTPVSGESKYKRGSSVSYSFALTAGYQNLKVTLDGVEVAASGSVTMNADHTLLATAENSMQLEWLLDGDAQDTSGWGRHGNVVNATLCPDHKGAANRAYYFNGTDAYIEGPNFVAQKNNSFSVSLWVNAAMTAETHYLVISNGLALSQTSNYILFSVSLPSTSSTSCPIQLSTWIHVAGTYDGTTMRIYLNGTLMNSKTHAGTPSNPERNFTLGVYSGKYWKGNLDDVRVYNYKLSDSEILALAGM